MRLRNILPALAAGLLTCSYAAAAAWPEQPITLVVPYTPGTGIDVVARQLSARLTSSFGQPVIVENMAGASGNIGSSRVARAAPDGYTLLVQVSTLVMNKSLYKSLNYDPVKGFAPVAQTSTGTLALVSSDTDATNVQSVVAKLKANPGKYSYATPGVGTPHHLSMALFLQKTGTTMLQVPYKGTAGAVTDLLGHRVNYMFLPVHVALPHIQSGRLRAIAVGSDKRVPQLPQVPTLQEAGVAVGDIDMWYGVLAPKGTPASIVDKLNQEISRIVSDPQIALSFEAQGMVPKRSSPEQFKKLIEADAARWAAVVNAGNIVGE